MADTLNQAAAIREEDLLETLETHPALAPQTRALKQAGFDWGQIVQALGPYVLTLIGQILHPPPKPPAPPVEPPAPPVPPVVPPVRVPRIVGGRGKITGITEGGPTGPRVDAARLAQIIAGTANAPHDSRFEIDITPMFEDGSFAAADDYRWVGQPNAPFRAGVDTVPPTQPIRLDFDYDGDGSADLSHEYANFGCSPRVRVKTPADSGGILSNLRARCPDYGDGRAVVITIATGPIHVGRGA